MLEKVPDTDGVPVENSAGTDVKQFTQPLTPANEPATNEKPKLALNILKGICQAILVGAVLLAAFYFTQKMIAEKPEPRKRRAFKTVYTVDTVTVKRGDYQPSITAYGQTVAARSVDLRALVSGELIKVNPKLRGGSDVAKGEALVEIDPFNYVGALSEARANLAEANARILESEAQIELEKGKMAAAEEQLEFAVKDLERALRLKKRGNTTQKEVEARKLVESQRKQTALLIKDTITVQESRLEQIKASVQRLQWRVNQAQRNVESTTLVAPFNGIVKSSTAEMGRVITANDVVVSMFKADTLEVRFTLTDAQYGRLQVSDGKLLGREVQVVWVIGGKEYTYPAKIDRVGAEISSTRGGVELFALIGKSASDVTIRPGAFVEVRVPDKKFKSTFSVPDTAVYGTDTVYVEVEGALVKKLVQIVAYDGEQALLSSGLEDGDKVLTTRITEVSEGLKVRREGDPDAIRSHSQNGVKTQGNAKAGDPSLRPAGRPTAEEITAILKNNGLSREEFRALPRPEKRKLIEAQRAKPEQ